MANHNSTKKSIRQVAVRTARNKARKTQIKTSIKKLLVAVNSGDKENAPILLKNAQKQIYKGVSKGVFKLNTASRKMSRLNKKVKNLVIEPQKQESKES